jgi:hypothetical protein
MSLKINEIVKKWILPRKMLIRKSFNLMNPNSGNNTADIPKKYRRYSEDIPTLLAPDPYITL